MAMNKEATEIGFAYVGIIAGAGFSAGQEVMQFFTRYGLWTYLGVIMSGFILASIERQVVKIGTAFEATDHESTLQYIFGEKFSKVLDYILIFSLFGIVAAMMASAGTTFEESYNILTWLGASIMTLAVYVTLLLDFNKIVRVLGVVTLFLTILVVLIAGVYLFKGHVSLAEVNQVVPGASIWKGTWSGATYGGLAFSVGFNTIVAIGGDTEKCIVSGAGVMYGGTIYTVLLALINFALQNEYSTIKNVSIPTLTPASSIHPLVATVLSVIMLAVMYNTILGLMCSFVARFICLLYISPSP